MIRLRTSLQPGLILLLTLLLSCTSEKKIAPTFDQKKDLLLIHFDCKTDVDDLHTIAAFATLLSNPQFEGIQYYTVAGTYGIQEGLYVPANELFTTAFGNKWSDAHTDFDKALKEVVSVANQTLVDGGDIWIAEAGQSDFSAGVVRQIKSTRPTVKTKERVHIVQHSNWNQDVTAPESLKFVQEHTDYQKIPDGNAIGNGTPGFRSEEVIAWENSITDPKLASIWNLGIKLGNQYNGVDGRYNNEAIAKGGLDFSDLSEVCWILDMADVADVTEFFERFGGRSSP